jgi:NitT/TauT family transport system substrate-binding protein
MKHPIVKNCWLLLGLFLLIPYAHARDQIRIGLSSVSAIHGAIWVAEEKGFLRKHGLDAEVIVTGQGATAGVSALIAGDIQFLNSAGDAIINAQLRGADAVIIAAVINKGLQRIMARPEIKTPEDLKGKKVGVTRFGAVSHLVLQLMLQRWGMEPNDVQVLQVGSSPAMIASLGKGGIDAAVLTVPSVFVAEDRGYRILADLADTDISYLHAMFNTTRKYLRANRDITRRFLEAYLEGIAYFKQHKRESLEVLKKKLRIDSGSERNLERSYDLLAGKFYEAMPYPSTKGIQTVLGFLEKDNPKAKGADPKSFVDDSVLREIDASEFVKNLYRN